MTDIDEDKVGKYILIFFGIAFLFLPFGWIISALCGSYILYYEISENIRIKNLEKKWEEEEKKERKKRKKRLKKDKKKEQKRENKMVEKRKSMLNNLENQYFKYKGIRYENQEWNICFPIYIRNLNQLDHNSRLFQTHKELGQEELFELANKVQIMMRIYNDNKNNKQNNFTDKAERIKEGREAKKEIIMRNLHHVYPVITDELNNKVTSKKDVLKDINYGIKGLEKAVENYDPKVIKKNFNLFANWWIKQSVLGAKVFEEKKSLMDMSIKDFKLKGIKNPSDEQKAQYLGINLKSYRELMAHLIMNQIKYLNTPVQRDPNGNLNDPDFILRGDLFSRAHIDAPIYGKNGIDYIEDFYKDQTF